jgi:zinc transporter ZupT
MKPDLSLRWQCALTAFGSGALLFAVTLSLFGEALYHIHQYGQLPLLLMLLFAFLGALFFLTVNYVLETNGAVFHIHFTRFFGRSLSRNGTSDNAQWWTVFTRGYGPTYTDQNDDDVDLAEVTPADAEAGRQTSPSSTVPSRGTPFNTQYVDDIPTTTSSDTTTTTNQRSEQPEKDTDGDHLHETEEQEIELAQSKELPQDEEDEEKGSGQLPPQQQQQQTHDSGNVGMSIWLGLLIDSFPESLVIGILTSSVDGMSFAFLVAVFLANLPEALSASIFMREKGMTILKILALWFSIVVATGIGAGFGSVIHVPENAPPNSSSYCLISSIEGSAAGAMLIVIANAMLPEAFKRGGNLTGLAMLLGFITAFLVEISDHWFD